MKKYFIKIELLAVLFFAIGFSACDLDINDNPNSATGSVVTPDLTLPAAVASLAYTQIYYYGYASAGYWIGFQLPGSGVSGFGDTYTYNLNASSNTANWTEVFAHLRQFNAVINKAEVNPKYALYGGISRILKAYGYQLLVDAYGDVPYTESLQGGAGNYLPKYDKGADIYKALIVDIDAAIASLKENQAKVGGGGVSAVTANGDPVFEGDINKWIKFANNLKLRLLIRAEGSEIDSFVKEAFGKFSSDGFLKENVLVNPGYNATSRQTPLWNTYHSGAAGSSPTPTQASRYYIPSRYVLSFYDGKKLTDNFRGSLIYKGFPNVPAGQLGQEASGHPDHPQSPTYIWYLGAAGSRTDAKGLLKSQSAPAPFFLSAEIYFLLAEAALNGHVLDGDAVSNFNKGIEASFGYLAISGVSTTVPSVTAEVAAYKADNSSNYLVNFDLATTTAQKLEAIITQKYIALNLINSNEAWNEFRRTAYPIIVNDNPIDPYKSFVSIQSNSTHHDKLPVKLVYPQSEINLNGDNVPATRNPFQDRVFWDKD
ncbi:hypothetical protein FACS189432_01130 [Bacteroidia bacterium]|nr:hypothetical protein FACS189426_03390 [Bacteroidia bacterium]GHT26532.1 hypothetical protein FACS189432_01130 [Bacteroidia bacterium]GHV71090.1 hypothetical protein FACS189420_4850 [Bacteroidia bacterium]